MADSDKQIREMEVRFVDGFNKKDFVMAASCYKVDGVLMPPGREAVIGRDEIATFLKGLYDSGLVKVKCDILNMHTINSANVL